MAENYSNIFIEVCGKSISLSTIMAMANRSSRTVREELEYLNGGKIISAVDDIKTTAEKDAENRQTMLGVHGRNKGVMFIYSNSHYEHGVKVRRAPRHNYGKVRQIFLPKNSKEYDDYINHRVTLTDAVNAYNKRVFTPKSVTFVTKDGKNVSFVTKKPAIAVKKAAVAKKPVVAVAVKKVAVAIQTLL